MSNPMSQERLWPRPSIQEIIVSLGTFVQLIRLLPSGLIGRSSPFWLDQIGDHRIRFVELIDASYFEVTGATRCYRRASLCFACRATCRHDGTSSLFDW